MAKRVNIADPEFEYDPEDIAGFRAGMARLTKALGAEDSGVSVYELPPGETICPYHYEVAEEEWLIVLSGRPTLRTPEGEEELGPWDTCFFPKGPSGAHAVRNGTDEKVRVLMFSNIVLPGASVYPDSDKVGIWTGDEDSSLLVRRDSAVDYYDGEG